MNSTRQMQEDVLKAVRALEYTGGYQNLHLEPLVGLPTRATGSGASLESNVRYTFALLFDSGFIDGNWDREHSPNVVQVRSLTAKGEQADQRLNQGGSIF
ncbi:hypothetical protein SAMN05216548_108201 [Faunimonas pinastri]|uniref:Uncharacterized protein n=1 Tax=Faunimonas pinastri TaxID=1855383 RepID=A0A1H9JNZ2_9HYPH|nr:hypothetical protein [Faunimonas pinastri]SEQ88550.1 hypothetical protein SAMN05216548_108201 [Faunimonas pinastri]